MIMLKRRIERLEAITSLPTSVRDMSDDQLATIAAGRPCRAADLSHDELAALAGADDGPAAGTLTPDQAAAAIEIQQLESRLAALVARRP